VHSIRRNVQENEMRCFECEGVGHQCRDCPNRKLEKEKAALIEIKRFDHETKVKARSERRNLQTASQLYTKQVGTGEINQIIESLLKVKVQRITKTYQRET